MGQRIRVLILKVQEDAKGPGVLISRVHPGLLRKLFELEVPEIFTGTIEIKSVAREAGQRSKIAVVSFEEGIDPIGSCVGQKGTRVQAIIEELNGERIDIIGWNEKTDEMIKSALSPAKVAKVDLDEKSHIATAHVPREQLSLAIGHRGQNVRLAAKLTDWRIDVVTLEDGEKKVEAEATGKITDKSKEERTEKKEKKTEEKKEKTDKKEKTYKKEKNKDTSKSKEKELKADKKSNKKNK